MNYLLVAIGGAIGSVARYAVALSVAGITGPGFPYGTVLINIAGSFVIGWFSAWSARYGGHPMTENARAFVMAGLCGGFTTFSAFSLQTMELLRAGETGRAMANVGVSVVVCIAATAAGLRLAGAAGP
jgi:CrcB protein